MSREHLYKAKRVNWRESPKEEQWFEGYYVKCQEHHYILPIYNEHHGFGERYTEWVEAEEETICKYMGLTDKNGRKIFENDIACLIITDQLMESTFSNSNLGKAVVKENISEVYIYFPCNCIMSLHYEVYFKSGGEIILNSECRPKIQARGEDSMFPKYLFEKGASVIGNIFDNPELLEGGKTE